MDLERSCHFIITPDITPSSPFIGPADVLRVPVIEPPSTSTRRGKAMVVTASPHKQEIMEAKKKQTEKNERAGRKKSENVKKTKPTGSNKNKNKTKKRRKAQSSDDESCNDDDPVLVSTDEEDSENSTDEEDSENDDAECPVCHNTYSQDKRGEKWIRCIHCFQWMHEDCVDNPGPKFVCTICLQN